MENLRILFITTDENKNLQYEDRCQGDYHENTALIGLRKLLGDDCVEYPRKRILYHDWSSVNRNSLHGKGFSLYHEPIQDITSRELDRFDVILYGTSFNYGMIDIPELEKICKIKFYIDGNDLYGNAPNNIYTTHNGERVIGNQISPCFKTQLLQENANIFPFGCGLPANRILPVNFKKVQLFQKSYPREAYFEPKESHNGHHCFTNEEEYYEDMSKSWFGLSCKRGGYDAMRNYEIIAAGAVLLYRDYHKKPPLCSPGDLPALSYSSLEELHNLMTRLVPDGKVTQEYLDILTKQRQWLFENGTTEARAKYIIKVLEKYVKN